MKSRTQIALGTMAFGASLLAGCMRIPSPHVVPAVDYSERIQSEEQHGGSQKVRGSRYVMDKYGHAVMQPQIDRQAPGQQALNQDRAALRLASSSGAEPMAEFGARFDQRNDTVTNMGDSDFDSSVSYADSSSGNMRPYTGPLTLGDPGTAASLWKESRAANDYFRDNRAWQPMDLITILITEKAQGTKQADTEVKSKATVAASITKFLGIEKWVTEKNPSIDPTALAEASTQNDSKGEGDTKRSGSLIAKISGMVVEVLPSGILRIEGQKIVSVNSEDEIMIISGLVKPSDVTSDNTVDSSKVANMRIDYYGEGNVGDAVHGGWMGNLMHRFWPF